MRLRNIFNITSFTKFLLSIPIILLVLYFLPVLGVIMLITRYFVYGSRHYYRAPIVLLIVSLILLIPHGLELAMANFGFELTIPYFREFISLGIYPSITEYAERIFIIGVVILIVSAIIKTLGEKITAKLSSKLSGALSNYFNQKEQTRREEIKLRTTEAEERIENSKKNIEHVVKCPHCGKVNTVTGTTGKCKSCRNAIQYKEK